MEVVDAPDAASEIKVVRTLDAISSQMGILFIDHRLVAMSSTAEFISSRMAASARMRLGIR